MTMTNTFKPRRSMLFMPASNPRALEKARTLAADVLIFDIEDAVAPDAKEDARAAAVAAAATRSYGRREILIRVNGLGTTWAERDLAAVATSAADGVVLPKVNNVEDIPRAAPAWRARGARAELSIWAMMETPRSILEADRIAAAGPQLAGLIVGTNDLAKDLHSAHPHDRAPMLYALQRCVMAARAYGIQAIDGVHMDLEDEAALAAACRQGRDLGFDGKSLIHPKQIAAANAAFAPSAEELARAERIVAAYKEAEAKRAGVAVLDGRLVEVLHAREAERLIAHAAAIRAAEQA